MFSFSGGGSASAGAFNNGNYNFGPVEYGNGGIVMGDFKTGDVVQSGSATAGGGNSTQSFAFNPPQQQQQQGGGGGGGLQGILGKLGGMFKLQNLMATPTTHHGPVQAPVARQPTVHPVNHV